MSYAGIRGALATRVAAVTGIEASNVFQRYKWSLDATTSQDFIDDFVDSNSFVNFVIISRSEQEDSQPIEDNLSLRRHSMEIHLFYSLFEAEDSEHTFQDLIEGIASDLESGNRELGGAAFCYSLSVASIDELAGIGNRGDTVHHAEITTSVYEVI